MKVNKTVTPKKLLVERQLFAQEQHLGTQFRP
jgi:hypothetical protein